MWHYLMLHYLMANYLLLHYLILQYFNVSLFDVKLLMLNFTISGKLFLVRLEAICGEVNATLKSPVLPNGIKLKLTLLVLLDKRWYFTLLLFSLDSSLCMCVLCIPEKFFEDVTAS